MKKSLPEDYSLWACFIQGDEDAFSLIYSRYIDILYAYGRRYLKDEDLLQDCLQELFIDLYKYRRSLSSEVNIKFYLFRALKNQINRSVRHIQTLGEKTSSYDFLTSYDFELCISAEDTLIRNEERAESLILLTRELDLLPSRQKEILYLRFNSGLEYDEIAVLLQISVASCRTLVFRAIKQLRKKLEHYPAKNLLVLLTLFI